MRFSKIVLATAICYSGVLQGFCISHTHTLPQLSLGAGAVNVCHGDPAGQFQLEYRTGIRVWDYIFPLGGFMASTKGSGYLYGGFGADFVFMEHFAIVPSLAAGFFWRGDGSNLRYPLEFRSAIEFAYVFDKGNRVGFQFSHISNASIGHKNPGEESLVFTYTIPFEWNSNSKY